MSFSDFLFSLAIGFFLFVVYTAELFRAGKIRRTPARQGQDTGF